MDSNVNKYLQGRSTPPSPILPMNSNDPQPQRHPTCSDRAMEIDGLADLSLFRSHSMPIPTFAGRGAISDQFHRSLEDQDEGDEEEDEDDDDLLTTPPFIPPPIKSHPSCQRLLSCSLPPSLDRRKTYSSQPQHENALHEFFQLTQPMREGLISREKLLPSSRMKQVGIGGRGRRALSTHKKPPNISSPTGESMKTEQEGGNLLSPTKFDQSLCSPGSSSSMYQQSMNYNLSSSIGSNGSMTVHSQFAQVPLIRPRPVLAWDHPSRQLSKRETPASNPPESNYQIIK